MRNYRILPIFLAGALTMPPALAQTGLKPNTTASVKKAPGPEYGTFGFDTLGMGRHVAAGDDWITFTNGTYQEKLIIPVDQPAYGMFLKLRDLSKARTRNLVEAAAARKRAKPGSETQKVGDYYASFMDEKGIEALGMASIKPELEAIAAIADKVQLAMAFGRANRLGVDVPMSVATMQDYKNPNIIAVNIGQGGLGLPDRDYYLDTKNPRFAEIRGKYVTHVAAMLKLAGLDNAEARAKAIMALETRIAEVQWSLAESRQVEKLYNPVKTADLATSYPGLDWLAFLAKVGIPDQKEVVMTQPSALRDTAKLMDSELLATWKDYLSFHTLSAAAPYLPKAVQEEDFAFKDRVLSGQLEMKLRWKRGVESTTEFLGEALGKLYVAKYFPPEAKKQADALVTNIIAAMDGRLANLTWLDPKTKEAARTKLASFTPKIGYPSKWRDYSKLEIRRGDAFGNAVRAYEFEFQRNLDKIGKPVDRTEWGMTPMTVNAYANPFWNEIVFPAAILQPPFFDPQADPAVNYGGIGVVIGHEISHHFDDQGRKFDKEGKLSDWWTPEDIQRFKVLTDKVVKQYSEYEPLHGSYVNGELTLGENMADLAGINVSLDAYHRSLDGKPAKVIGGFTGDQRFFLGFAQVWRSKYRDAALLRQITTNEHTPGFLRPNVVRNVDAWYQAFDVKPGQKMYLAPEDRIKVW
jgi:putative endopeptidase